MINCKKCGVFLIVKNGAVNGKQRYKCSICGSSSTAGDRRVRSIDPARIEAASRAQSLYDLCSVGADVECTLQQARMRMHRERVIISYIAKEMDITVAVAGHLVRIGRTTGTDDHDMIE